MPTRRSLVTGLATFFVLATADLRAQSVDEAEEQLRLEEVGYGLLYNYDFEEADQAFRELGERFPDFAGGPYGEAVTLWLRLAQQGGVMRGDSHRSDRYWSQSRTPEVSEEEAAFFEERIGEARRLSEEARERNPGDPVPTYYLGAVESLASAWSTSMERSYFRSARLIRKAAELHREVVSAHPEFTDAYQVPGAQDYAVATLPRALRMVAFVFGMRGDKERGLEWLARTAEEGRRSKWGALWTLALFLQREDRTEQALEAIRELREAFPRNPDYALEEAGILIYLGETQRAREELLEVIEKRDSGFGNYHLAPPGLPELRLGETWLYEEKWEEAEQVLTSGLESSPAPDTRVVLHFRRGNARDGMGDRDRALFDYTRVRQFGGDEVLEDWAGKLRRTPWPEGAPEGSRPVSDDR